MSTLALALMMLVRSLGGPCVELTPRYLYVGRMVVSHDHDLHDPAPPGGISGPHCHGLIYYRPFF